MKKCIFVILILSFFLTGCWDRRELNEIAITLALGIDKIEDEYQVSAQVVVPSELAKAGGKGSSTATLYTARGDTIFDAFRTMTKDSPRKIYPGHLQILVISEELAQEGIGKSLEFFSRDPELRPDFYVVIAKDVTAKEVLNVSTTLESIPANKMFNSLEMSSKAWAGTKSVTLDELIADLVSDGKEAVLTGIKLIGNFETGSSKQNVESISPKALIQYDNLAVFKGDKLIGWLSEKETIGYSYITDSVKTTARPISCPNDGTATIEVIRFKSDVKGNTSYGKPEVNINIKAEGNVGSVECKINLNDSETIYELEKIYEKELEEIVKETFDTLQNRFKSDIFGFGEAIHRSNPEKWNKIKDNWDQEFPNLTINANVELKILNTGTINSPFLEKIED